MDQQLLGASPRFERHLFVCVNQRAPESPKGSCGACGEALRLRFVDLISKHGLKGRVRASKALCLDACELGPVVLIQRPPIAGHPGAEYWYLRVGPEDAEAIFTASVLGDTVYAPRLAGAEDWQRLRQSRAAEKLGKVREPAPEKDQASGAS